MQPDALIHHKISTCSRAPVSRELLWWPQSSDLSAWFGVYTLTYGSTSTSILIDEDSAPDALKSGVPQ